MHVKVDVDQVVCGVSRGAYGASFALVRTIVGRIKNVQLITKGEI